MDWLKLWHEIRRDRKLATLPREQRWVWVALMCFAGEQGDRGVVPALSPRILAAEVADGDLALLRECVEAFTELDMLEPLEDGSYRLKNWVKRQSAKPSDDPKRVRERVTRHREAKCNAPVTPLKRPCNALETPSRVKSKDSQKEESLTTTPPIIPPTPTPAEQDTLSKQPAKEAAIAEAARGLPKRSDIVLAKFEDLAADMLGRPLNRKQRELITAVRNEYGDRLTCEVVDLAFDAAALYSGDKLAYVFKVISNKIRGVPKHSGNGHATGPPDGYSWEIDETGRYVPLGGDPRTGKLPYGARDALEANRRHKEISIQQRTAIGGVRN